MPCLVFSQNRYREHDDQRVYVLISASAASLSNWKWSSRPFPALHHGYVRRLVYLDHHASICLCHFFSCCHYFDAKRLLLNLLLHLPYLTLPPSILTCVVTIVNRIYLLSHRLNITAMIAIVKSCTWSSLTHLQAFSIFFVYSCPHVRDLIRSLLLIRNRTNTHILLCYLLWMI